MELCTIDGTVERITYRDETSLFSVIRFKLTKGELTTAVGLFPSVYVGQTLRLMGEWTSHKSYGKQFKVQDVEEVTPNTLVGLEKYLGSGMINGIGPVYAKKLVNTFGIETLQVIDRTPEKLLEIEGIGEKKAEKIVKAVREHKSVSKVMVFLQGNGVSPAFAIKIYKAYGDGALDVVKNNPYKLADEIFGIGFRTADKIAANLGIDGNSPQRIMAGIKYILATNAENGHCYVEKSQLTEEVSSELEVEANDVLNAINELSVTNQIILEDDAVYLALYYYCERGVANKVAELAQAIPKSLSFTIEDQVSLDKELHIKLGEKQFEAVESSISAGVFVLTGGPGTGKTTTIRAIINLFEKEKKKIYLAAPTGRAAKRLSEASRKDAKTIHRLLEFELGPEGWNFKRNSENPLACDVLIVDEVSMVDIVLMYHLLRAVKLGTQVILVGDVDQLPSVGPGNVLKDIILSGKVDTVALNHVFRQAAQSHIVSNAHRINQGMMPYVPDKPKDFFFVSEEDPELVVDKIRYLVTKTIPDRFNLDPIDDIQVLSPMRRTSTGVDNLNVLLKETLNPHTANTIELRYAGSSFRLGDKVMQIKNNYEKMVWNGDSGRIVKIDTEDGEVVVRYPENYGDRDIVYQQKELDELTLSYCVSIHKSQGSEYPCVIIPVTTQHYIMLQRNLIYTGITRGKKAVVLVGTKKALAMAVKNGTVSLRRTRLCNRIMERFDAIL